MNLYEQLLVVHERLEGIGAHDDSMDLVDKLLQKTEPAREDNNIYNDLQELLSERDENEIAAHEDAAPAAYMDTERHPKPKSFYKAKAKKEKEKKG